MAKVSPLYTDAVLYGVATDDGQTVFDAAGELQFDRISQTYGYADKSKETVFTANNTYEGSHLVTVISNEAPNGLGLILLGYVFYAVHSVHSSDVLSAPLTLDRVPIGVLDRHDQPDLWEASQFLCGIDLMIAPGEYMYSVEQVKQEYECRWKRKSA